MKVLDARTFRGRKMFPLLFALHCVVTPALECGFSLSEKNYKFKDFRFHFSSPQIYVTRRKIKVATGGGEKNETIKSSSCQKSREKAPEPCVTLLGECDAIQFCARLLNVHISCFPGLALSLHALFVSCL